MKILKILVIIMITTQAVANIATAKEIKYYEETLDNGLEVIYCIDKSAPIIASALHYKVGSKDELAKKSGYAHFFEHLMFEATDNIPRAEIPKYVNEAGGSLNAHTSFDETVYQFKLPANQIKLALWIESQRMRGLHIEKVGVDTQRGVVMEEKKARVDNQPYGTMLEKMTENMFGTGTYGWTTIGKFEDLEAAKISDFQSFYNNFYRPDNAILSICGDFKLSEMKQLVRDYMADIKGSAKMKRPQYNISELKKEYRETVEDEKAQIPVMFIGFRIPPMTDPDYYAVNLLTSIMASGQSSRLHKSIVDEQEIAQFVGLNPLALELSGVALFIAAAKMGGKEEELAGIEKEIYKSMQEVIEDGVSDSELEKTRNIIEADLVYSKKNVLSKAMQLARYKAYFGDASLMNTEIDKYNAVTKADLQRVAKKYFDTDKRVVLNYIPKINK